MQSVHKKIGGSKFDAFKFLLSLGIVGLHYGLFPTFLKPLSRIIVPLFFMITSYFLFSKIEKQQTEEQRQLALLKFIKRNFLLLLFWTCFFIIPIWIIRDMNTYHFPYVIIYFFQLISFKNTFVASWFISASILSSMIIYYLSYKLKIRDLYIMIFGFISYLFCCVTSMYSDVLLNCNALRAFNDTIKYIIGYPFNSFPAALIWILFGKLFVNYEIKLNLSLLFCLSALSLLLLYAEYFIVYLNYIVVDDDCFFSLLIFCPLLMAIMIKLNDIPLKNPLLFRKLSVVIFCTHGTPLALFRHFGISSPLIKILCLCFSFVLFFLIIKYENKIKILRHSC